MEQTWSQSVVQREEIDIPSACKNRRVMFSAKSAYFPASICSRVVRRVFHLVPPCPRGVPPDSILRLQMPHSAEATYSSANLLQTVGAPTIVVAVLLILSLYLFWRRYDRKKRQRRMQDQERQEETSRMQMKMREY